MKTDTIQTSFVGGEFGPSLFGRTDVAQYENACATLENFLVRPYGPIISTPGTEFIAECKTGGTTGVVRLLNFTFSQTDAYIIEMGVGYFRFYTDGAVVVSPGTTPYEVAHTYTADELFDVQFAQVNDIIYLAHANHAPATLIRSAASSWALSALAFKGGPYQLDNPSENITITVSATTGTINVTVSPTSTQLFFSGDTGAYYKFGGISTNSTTGLEEQGYFKMATFVNNYTATATVLKILSTTASSIWASPAWTPHYGWPARVAFFQQRIFFARTKTQPQNIWGSKNFEYTEFALDGGFADDALNIQVASNQSNDIKWLASGRALLAGTYGGEFVIQSGDQSPLTPYNTTVTQQTSWGSEDITPKTIGNYLYYVQRFGRKLRELFYFWDLDTYKSIDKTVLSPHISGGGFKEMTFQQNPDTILWAVCSNGTIATMTREVDQEVQGWSRQTTSGLYESVSDIPSKTGSHDEVWVVVNRTINGAVKRYIERFYSQVVPDRQDKCVYLHSALTYDAYEATSTGTINISLSSTAGTSVLVTSSGAYFSAGDVGDRIRAIDSTANTVGELKIIGYTSSTVVVGRVVNTFDASSYVGGLWGLSVTSISGLSHLEAATVSVLADGGTDKPNKTVSGGTITLAYDYFVVNAGLPYSQKVTTLAQEAASQRGTAQGKIQRINQAAFKVNRSYKGFQVGGGPSYLESIQFRDPTTLMGTPEKLYTGVIPNISFRGNYEYGAQVYVQNDEPLPIEFLNIITTIDTNDK